MATQPKYEDDTDADKLERLRRMLAELSEALRETEAMLKQAADERGAR